MFSLKRNAFCCLHMAQQFYATIPGAQMKSILDKSFRYTKSIDTDLRKTFAKIKREQRQQARVQTPVDTESKVVAIGQRKTVAAA